MVTRARGGSARVTAVLAAAALLTLPASAASAGVVSAGVSRTGPVPTVMVLLDTNASLPGAGFAAERRAALHYLHALPAGVRAGLITFNDKWRIALSPTASRARFTAALAAATPAGSTSTAIDGALPAAASVVHHLGGVAGSRLLVLSNAEMIFTPVLAVRIPTDVVTWHFDSDDYPGRLRAPALASGGRVVPAASAAALARAVPATVDARGPVSQAPPVSPAAQPSAAAHGSWPGSLIVALAGVFLALLVIALLGIGSLYQGERGRQFADQIERYGPRRRPAGADADREGSVARAAVGLTTQVLQSSNAERGLAARLEVAGITRSPAEWALLGGCVCLVLAATLTLAMGNILIGLPGGILIGWLGMRLRLTFRIARRRAAFSQQLPDLLQLIAGSLQSGFSLPQALDSVVREDAQPAASEFSRALAEARLGADLEDSLEGVANRMDSEDLRWTVMAIRIQRSVGGNLAEVLRGIVGTMRERAYLRRQVRSLSAEGRLSAYILIALPILVGGWLFLTSRGYMKPLYTTPVGVLMLLGAGVMVVLGSLWMRALIKIEV